MGKLLAMCLCALLLPLSVGAQGQIEISAKWVPPTTTVSGGVVTPEQITYYSLYACESPIIEHDNGVRLDPVTCGRTLYRHNTDQSEARRMIPVEGKSGKLYFRVSATRDTGETSKLSDEFILEFPQDKNRLPDTPTDVRAEPLIPSADAVVSLSVTWSQKNPEKVSYYRLHVCDSPILAGGPDKDEPGPGLVLCNQNLYEIRISEPLAQLDIPVERFTSPLYMRVNAVGKNDKLGRLSKEVKVEPPAN